MDIFTFLFLLALFLSIIELLFKYTWFRLYYLKGLLVYKRKIAIEENMLENIFNKLQSINSNLSVKIVDNIIYFRGPNPRNISINTVMHGNIKEVDNYLEIEGYLDYSIIALGFLFTYMFIYILISLGNTFLERPELLLLPIGFSLFGFGIPIFLYLQQKRHLDQY
jgi:hypothetical protein